MMTAVNYHKLGDSFYEKGQNASAIKAYTNALRLNSKEPIHYASRGQVYYKEKRYIQAIIDFNNAIRFNPKYAAVYIYRAQAYYEREQYQLAFDDFKTAHKLAPDCPYHVYDLGRTAYKLGDPILALTYLEKALLIMPQDQGVIAYQQMISLYLSKLKELSGIGDSKKRIEIEAAFFRRHPEQFNRKRLLSDAGHIHLLMEKYSLTFNQAYGLRQEREVAFVWLTQAIYAINAGIDTVSSDGKSNNVFLPLEILLHITTYTLGVSEVAARELIKDTYQTLPIIKPAETQGFFKRFALFRSNQPENRDKSCLSTNSSALSPKRL